MSQHRVNFAAAQEDVPGGALAALFPLHALPHPAPARVGLAEAGCGARTSDSLRMPFEQCKQLAAAAVHARSLLYPCIPACPCLYQDHLEPPIYDRYSDYFAYSLTH